ncbi:YolD-like family protein [Priestia megaterium]|uniref:YolD-like family protein n=1 Tax=Priestia megaterium TaxID=1404 RepID=UPI00101D99A7|nr:YolD-like family protein [Priestia megaterium]
MNVYQDELKQYAKLVMPEHLEKMKKMYSPEAHKQPLGLKKEKIEHIENVIMNSYSEHHPVTLHVYEAGHIQRYERVTIDKVSLQSNTLMVTGPCYTYSIRADAVIEADVWKDESYSS